MSIKKTFLPIHNYAHRLLMVQLQEIAEQDNVSAHNNRNSCWVIKYDDAHFLQNNTTCYVN